MKSAKDVMVLSIFLAVGIAGHSVYTIGVAKIEGFKKARSLESVMK